MGYYINRRKNKLGKYTDSGWGAIFEYWENNKKKRQRIKVSQLQAHGFMRSMTYQEASDIASQLNARDRVKKDEAKKVKALANLAKHTRLEHSLLNSGFCKKFEKDIITKQAKLHSRDPEYKIKKLMSRWALAQKIIVELNKEPSDWFDDCFDFYQYFIKREFSLDYTSKIISMLNMWGYFICRETGKAFLPIPPPRHVIAEKIINAYNNSEKKKKESIPLTPEMLDSARSKFSPKQVNWMLLTIWFGLRPGEATGLKDKSTWKIEERTNSRDGKKIRSLCVFQSKLTNVPNHKKWKAIPILFPQQKKLLAIIEKGEFKKPLCKTLKKHIHKDLTLYGGRKGFVDLMSRPECMNQPIEFIYEWMGHQSIDTLFKYYRDRTKVSAIVRRAA